MPEPQSGPLTSYPKHKIKVLLLENIHSNAVSLFEEDGLSVQLLKGALSEPELGERIRDVHMLGIRSKTRVSAATLAQARRLLALGCFCIGTNQVALDAANLRGVPVFNAPFGNTRSVAELVLAEVIVLARKLGDRSMLMHQGHWEKSAQGCVEVRGKTLGIVGYGHIGSQVGVLAEGVGMRVLFYDILKKLPLGNNRPTRSFEELLPEVDFLTLHVPATPLTRNMIGAQQLAAMKPGAKLLNASRGSVVQIGPLAAALRSGQIGGAAIDVFPDEPAVNQAEFDSELRGLPNVFLTPHIAGATTEAQEAIGREVATSLLKFINQGISAGAVNFPQVEPPPLDGRHRILHVHRNVPGVLSQINRIVSEAKANIESQVLSTDASIGYLVMDLDKTVSEEVHAKMAKLDASIRSRILY